MIETHFETLEVPAVHVTNPALLALYGNGVCVRSMSSYMPSGRRVILRIYIYIYVCVCVCVCVCTHAYIYLMKVVIEVMWVRIYTLP